MLQATGLCRPGTSLVCVECCGNGSYDEKRTDRAVILTRGRQLRSTSTRNLLK